MKLERDAEPQEEITDEGGVLVGAREDHAHLLEGNASSRFRQEPTGDGSYFRGLAGRRHELYRGIPDRLALRRLEEPSGQARQTGGRRRGSESGEGRVGPAHGGNPHPRRPFGQGLGVEGGSKGVIHPPDGNDRGESRQEFPFGGIELDVVDDEDLRLREPRRGETRRGGLQEGPRVGEAALDGL